ncbi:MAG: hypothetical protein EOM10_03055 [Opitutae bacterium]|nr:hypothetical protein [Opitutae bacterium]
MLGKAGFPRYGKLFGEFSTVWKTFNDFFHAMENFLRNFPQYGKLLGIFSTLWKTFSRFFHSMENFFEVFPRYGKLWFEAWETGGKCPFSEVFRLLDRGCGAEHAAPLVSRRARPTERPGKTVSACGGQRPQPHRAAGAA